MPILGGTDEKETITSPEIKELNVQVDGKEDSSQIVKEAELIKKIFLVPAGYPITPYDAPGRTMVSINKDINLFQAYAIEQWMGLNVKMGDYIFDQLLLPDFAFKVKNIIPQTSKRIGPDTNFIIVQNKRLKQKFKPISFEEVVGNKKAIEKAEIIIEYLKDPKKFGDWAPKNILFYGPPGTGKTLTAKAIASTAKCSFIAKKGTTLIGLHVGDGASKIHALFREARSLKPAIIFIDEIDSIALNRNYQNVRGDVVEVATALLSELDGLDPSDGVITIAATNGIGLLDYGIRNRFEEEIEFPLPSEEERKTMLELFSKKIPQKIEIDFNSIAKLTVNWSGRALHEKLIKIAVHRAIRKKMASITTQQLKDIINEENCKNNEKKTSLNLFS